MNWRIDPNLPLELFNGAGMVLEFCFIGMMTLYLWRETRRRNLGLRQWITCKLPPSMNFAIAVIVCDGGILIRAIVIWAWRRFFDASDFGPLQTIMLMVGAGLIGAGALCKIRAISKPDHGDGPWLAAAGATGLFVLVTLYYH